MGLASLFFSSRRRHTRFDCDWSSDVCSSDLLERGELHEHRARSGRPEIALVDAAARHAPLRPQGTARAGQRADLTGDGRKALHLMPRGTASAGGQLRQPLALAAQERSEAESVVRSEEHTSELQSQSNIVCRLLLEKKKNE